MTAFATAVLAVLLAGPRHVTDRDEGDEARRARLEQIAVVIADVSQGDPVRAARLIAQGRHETYFARYVQTPAGCLSGPLGARCDLDRKGKPRARSYYQNWQVSCVEGWRLEPGSLEELRAFTRCTDRLMRSGSKRCSLNGADPVHGAFAGARGGASCSTPTAERRVRTFRAVLARLQGRKAES